MKNAKLKEQITSMLVFHYDRGLWGLRPEKSYEEAIEPLVNDMIRIATYHKRGWDFHPFQYSELDMRVTTATGEEMGDNLRELRAQKGWTLAEFSKRADLNMDYLRCVERGEQILRVWELEQIVDTLRVKSSAILPF